MTDLATTWVLGDELPAEKLRTARTVYESSEPLIRVSVEWARLPEWAERFANSLRDLVDAGVAKDDWNGHNARGLQPQAIQVGLRVLSSLLGPAPERPFPAIVPTFRGGLCFEWRDSELELEVDVDPNGSVEVFFTDHIEQKEWDGTLTEREFDVHAALDRLGAGSAASLR